MEKDLRLGERLVELAFEPNRNASGLLALAYQRMLATEDELSQCNSSVQEVPLLVEAVR